MSKTMKAAVVREFGAPLQIEEVPVPEVAPGMIQVAIQASGVCHTDLHAAEGDWPVKPEPPFIPGHEGVGFVSAVGAGVTNVKEGDRVGVPWLYTACGHCNHCLGGWETLCESQLNTGYSVNGGFADYVLADPDYVGHLPDNVGFNEIAPVLCAGVTVYKGLKMTETKPGDALVVSGIGGLGHMAVQYAVAMGLNVVAVDVDDAKLDLAKRLGAKEVVNARTDNDPAATVKTLTSGGARGALVTAVSEKAFEQAVGMVGRGGTIALNGLPPGDFPLNIFGMVLNGITVRGSIVGTRLDLQESLDFAGDGKVKATISTAKLDDINAIFKRMHKGQIEGRVVLDLTQ
ncbi:MULTISPECIES: alcohol dehydrogenase AdhP [unclassified Erythrobacter]|uniref:alcohol dehydrogenase AdhP n=1 Tax=unclassified Erythrobacter TaxID=2633097 RepID=UPI00076C860D|nr:MULTISPECIES: alcohol dehydrogenase AdhP [unclassified Erythrobacter]KWV94361.1 alcohol dehydrogenase [Erythrobacter sp. AP23]MBO6531338.1 alcohol dehydrogenase AdhP [Erythrobacter sp.]MBO6767842.1 alcohol dehydrogenase AdhP [Erythrobacter sp.]